MKSVFYVMCLLLAIGFSTNPASAQPPCQRPYNQVGFESFFYYPQSNVYFSVSTHQYIYPSPSGWHMAYKLPRHMRIRREHYVRVEHRGFDVWHENARHQYTYGRRYAAPPAIVYGPDRGYHGY
jgi:hypothetical protein